MVRQSGCDPLCDPADPAGSCCLSDCGIKKKQNQIKEQITTLFSQYDLKVLEVDPKVNEKGTIEKIDIKTDKLRHTKKLKTAISNFYNMKESNINISE